MRRFAVGIREGRVVSDAPSHCDLLGARLCGVCPVALCHGDGWGRVILGASGVVVPWGLVRGVFGCVWLCCIVSCRVVSCRVVSCHVLSRRAASRRVGSSLLSCRVMSRRVPLVRRLASLESRLYESLTRVVVKSC